MSDKRDSRSFVRSFVTESRALNVVADVACCKSQANFRSIALEQIDSPAACPDSGPMLRRRGSRTTLQKLLYSAADMIESRVDVAVAAAVDVDVIVLRFVTE